MRSAPVLERAVKLSGSRISAETLGQRLEVEAAKDADVLTIRVVDSTATGAAQLADAVAAAYDQVVARRSHEVAAQLLRARSEQLKKGWPRPRRSLPGTRTTAASGRSVESSQIRIVRS
jgi:capsular polysaccharide biosynthesis protein